MRALAAAAALLAATACLYEPKGSCDATPDCAAGEVCEGGVCVVAPPVPFGVDPASSPTVGWALHAARADTRFSVDAVGADLAGNVVVGGSVDAPFDFLAGAPTTAVTGVFAARLGAATGDPAWVTSFETFAHGRFALAVLPGGGGAPGDVFFAGTAFDPTAVGTFLFAPGPRGSLVYGRLDGLTGAPLWAAELAATTAAPLAPASLAVRGGDLLLAGTGAGRLGGPCPDPDLAGTADASFVALLDGVTGECRWVRWLKTRALTRAAPAAAGRVAVAGPCAPSGAWFDPGFGQTCARGLFVASLDGNAGGSTVWARSTPDYTGTVASVRDLAVAPDGRATVLGAGAGRIIFGRGPGSAVVDLGTLTPERSFAATWDASGAFTALAAPHEAPYAADPSAALFSRAAYDPRGRLWLAGRYVGAPLLGGVRFTACRAPCVTAAFLTRLDAAGAAASFLPLRVERDAAGAAFVDELALFATTGTVAAALRATGDVRVGAAPAWTGAATDLAVLRALP